MNYSSPMDTILRSLCVRDPRNPGYDASAYDDDDPKPQPRVDCACDCCYYGRDRLAVEILHLLGEARKARVEAMREVHDMIRTTRNAHVDHHLRGIEVMIAKEEA